MIIAVVVTIPSVVVLDPTVVTVPITREVLLPVVVRTYPVSARIWGSRPVARVPFVMVSYRIPVAINPDEVRTRPYRGYSNYTRRRRRGLS